MGFSGSKISGHSGTSFKHRKAFVKIKEYYNKNKKVSRNKSNEKEISEKEGGCQREYKVKKFDKVINLGFKLPLFIVFTIALIIVGKNYTRALSKSFLENRSNAQIERALNDKIESENAYRVLTRTGFDYLRYEQLNEAQSEFTRALKINSYGKEARIGLTKVLEKKCNLYGEFCKEAELNLEYLKQMNYLEEI